MSDTRQDLADDRLFELEERLQTLCDRYNDDSLDTKGLIRAVEKAIEGFTPTQEEDEEIDDEEDGS